VTIFNGVEHLTVLMVGVWQPD